MLQYTCSPYNREMMILYIVNVVIKGVRQVYHKVEFERQFPNLRYLQILYFITYLKTILIIFQIHILHTKYDAKFTR